MSNNVFFSEIYSEESGQIATKLVVTEILENADYVVVNDTTTIREELKEAQVAERTLELINSIGIFNLASEDKETIHDIDPNFIRQMRVFLDNENAIVDIKKIEREEKKTEIDSFTCVDCVCFPVCRYVDKVNEAMAELSSIGIKLTACDYFVKYNS